MKSNIKKLDTTGISEKMVQFFADPGVEETARQTQFVRRKSEITGVRFLKAVVLGFLEKPSASLNELAQSFLDLGVAVSAQGIDERINVWSVRFLRAIFSQALAIFRNKSSLPLAVLQQFSAINIVDSSTKTLPAHMADAYPGCGRRGAQAALKIQLVFDFLHGNLKQVALETGIDSDQGYREYLQVVEGGSLTLVDLGYFCLDAFRVIANKEAYFLSRYFYPTGLVDAVGQRIDLEKLLRKQTQASNEVPVQLGCRPQHQLPCRLIILRNPKSVTEKRRRRAKAHAQKRGTTLSQTYLFLLGWTLFVTNAPDTLIRLEHVYDFYRIRWQIELIFKLWKSYCGLNHILGWRKERVLTELYAKLIGTVIVHFLLAPLRIPDEVWSQREVSPVRFQQILARFARSFQHCLTDPLTLEKVLEYFLIHVQRFALKQKRRTHPNSFALLADLALPLA